MNNWLKIFAYNAGLTVVPFILSALVIVLTAALTATYHSTKAAVSNPATILRTE